MNPYWSHETLWTPPSIHGSLRRNFGRRFGPPRHGDSRGIYMDLPGDFHGISLGSSVFNGTYGYLNGPIVGQIGLQVGELGLLVYKSLAKWAMDGYGSWLLTPVMDHSNFDSCNSHERWRRWREKPVKVVLGTGTIVWTVQNHQVCNHRPNFVGTTPKQTNCTEPSWPWGHNLSQHHTTITGPCFDTLL